MSGPVLLLHGSADSPSCWRGVSPRLGRECVTPTLECAVPDGMEALTVDLPWLEGLLTEHQPVATVAHSYGGLLALRAATAGLPVGRLCVIEPIAFGLLDGEFGRGPVARLDEEFVEGARRGEPDEAFRWLVDYWNGPGAWDGLTERARGRLLAGMERTIGEVRSGARDATRVEDVEGLEGVLVLVGERTTAEARRLCRILADATGTLQVIAGAGHQSARTHPAAVAAAISAWLDA